MLALYLVLFAATAFGQSEQEMNAILQFKARSGSLVTMGFSELEFSLQKSPDCSAPREQVKRFLLDRFPVPASCVRAKKLEKKYLEALDFVEGDCELQIHDLELAINNPAECKIRQEDHLENHLSGNEISQMIDDFIQDKHQSYFNCPEDSVDCINECDVYATLILQSMVKTNNISKGIHATLESSIEFACKADRNSNCVDALAAVSKNMPTYIYDSADLKSCVPKEQSRELASVEEDGNSLFARIHAKIVGAASAGKL